MIFYILPIVVASVLLVSVGIAIGHSRTVIRLREEENRKREIEYSIISQKAELMKAKERITSNIDEIMFKASIHREIEDITRPY